MKKVIITGADGFVGSYTVDCFLENGVNVLALDIADFIDLISNDFSSMFNFLRAFLHTVLKL